MEQPAAQAPQSWEPVRPLVSSGKNDEAIRTGEPLTQTDGKNGGVWLWLGRAYFAKGMTEQAERAYNLLSIEVKDYAGADGRKGVEVFGVDKEGPGAKAGIRPGDILLKLGDATFAGTSEFVEAALKSPPGQPVEVQLLRGGAQLSLPITPGSKLGQVMQWAAGQPGIAVVLAQKKALGQRLNPPPAIPEEAVRHTARGEAFLKGATNPADFQKGFDEFHQAWRLAPWWGDAWFNLGVAQKNAGNPQAAIASFKRFLLAAPTDRAAPQVQREIYGLEVEMEKYAATGNWGGRWSDAGGSIYTLRVEGNQLRMVYLEPSKFAQGLGVHTGDTDFTGTSEVNRFKGKLSCGPTTPTKAAVSEVPTKGI